MANLKPINPQDFLRFAVIAGLELSTLLSPSYKNAWFQRNHSIIFYTGKPSHLSNNQLEGIIIADWLGKKTLRIYPTLPLLFPGAFKNVISTASPFFVHGRNLLPSQFEWIQRKSDVKRVLVLDLNNVPLGIGFLRFTSEGKEMVINEVNIGDFFRQEKKAKRRMKK